MYIAVHGQGYFLSRLGWEIKDAMHGMGIVYERSMQPILVIPSPWIIFKLTNCWDHPAGAAMISEFHSIHYNLRFCAFLALSVSALSIAAGTDYCAIFPSSPYA